MHRKLLIVAALLSACNSRSPVTPDPIPTPIVEPTPRPTPAWPFGVVFCCNGEGWPLATDGDLQRAADAGATMTHFRTGPFEPGSSDAAATTMPKLVHAVEFANGVGITPEIDLIDGWALVNKVNRWNDGCSVTKDAPPQRYIDHIKEVVNTVRSFKVTYQIGNEMGRCGPSLQWLQGIYNAAKAAGASRIGSDDPRVGDYLTVHGFSPTSNGAVLNETDNRVYTPAQWIWLYEESKKRAGYIMIWFGPTPREDEDAILEAFRNLGSVKGQCIVPYENDPGWVWPPASPHGAEMKEVVLAAMSMVPETCGRGDFATGFSQIEKVAAILLSRGVCAARSNDALFVRNSRGKFEEYHIFVYDTGCWSGDPHQMPKNIWTWR